MKVLWLGDLGPTGFGTVTMDLGRRLVNRGLDVRFISINDLALAGDELPEPFNSRTLSIPTLINVINQETGRAEVDQVRSLNSLLRDATKSLLANGEPWGDWWPDATVLLGDVANVRFQIAANPDLAKYKPFHYVPIEGVGLPKSLSEMWADLRPIAMTEFGADQIATVTGERPPVVYHGVDSQTFHPAKPSNPIVFAGKTPLKLTSKEECKQFWAAWFGMKVPKTWMLRTDRHMPRKRYNAMLRSLVPILATHPEAMMVIHCQHTDQGGSLPDTISKLPGVHEFRPERVSHPDVVPPQGFGLFDRQYPQIMLTNLSGLQREQLVSLYNAADLYLSTSAEGFGLTIAEALACGVPAVGLDYSAVPEVIGPAGVTVPCQLVDNEYDHFWATPDEKRFAEAVMALLDDAQQRETLGRKGPKHVRANFSWDVAASQFADLLQASVLQEAA